MTRPRRIAALTAGLLTLAATTACAIGHATTPIVPAAGVGEQPPVSTSSTTPAPAVAAPDARRQLAELAVAVRGNLDGYDRDKKFPHWKTATGSCDVREEVLKRDGQDVTVNARCSPVSGTWHSAYDGATWTKASDVDIDHMVPLAHAWISGAKTWPQATREAFANDLTRPQLLAVTDNVNQQKSDKAPDQWKPPLVSFWCTYATDWIAVKHHYGLTITVPERTALTTMLDHC
jgi:hypothetical protein